MSDPLDEMQIVAEYQLDCAACGVSANITARFEIPTTNEANKALQWEMKRLGWCIRDGYEYCPSC